MYVYKCAVAITSPLKTITGLLKKIKIVKIEQKRSQAKSILPTFY